MNAIVRFGFNYVLQTVVIGAALALVIYIFVASPHIVSGISMEPNFMNGDIYLANELSYRFHSPQRGDVIVFSHDATQDYIKRIIGLPGDTIVLHQGVVFLNGKELNESSYLASTVQTPGEDFLEENQTVTVPQGKYFVMGDNRPLSEDSREWGFIDPSAIKGKVFLVVWPLIRFGPIPIPTYNL